MSTVERPDHAAVRRGGTMRAAVLSEWNTLEVRPWPVPEPGPGEVLCRVLSCGLCGTDLKLVSGVYEGTWPPHLPFVIGHEWAGEIVELGPNVTRTDLNVGDRVVAENHGGCGTCRMCRAGRYNICARVREPGYKLYGHTAQGALAEYAARPEVVLHKIPDDIGDVAAALVNQAALACHGVLRTGLRPGDTAAVFGPGLVGLMTTQVARAVGAGKVIMVGRGERLALAERLGADVVVDYEQVDPVEVILEETGGRGADSIYECAGNPSVVPQALDSVARGGSVALLGLAGRDAVAEIRPDRLTLDEINLMGVRSSPNAYPRTVSLFASGAIAPGPLVDDTYALTEAQDAIEALAKRTSLRPIVLP
jgi:L-iditol 2-dehydrogenase